MGSSTDEVYKWTDESGNVHYADIKPNNRESTKIKVRSGKSLRPSISVQEKASALDARNLEKQQKQAQKQQQEAQQNETQSLCQAIRNNLKKFEENSRIKINEDGQLRYLAPDEITSKKAEFKRMLEENC